jgi:hypothetical protein
VEQYDERLSGMLEFLDVMNTLFNLVVKAGDKGVRRVSKTLARFAR